MDYDSGMSLYNYRDWYIIIKNYCHSIESFELVLGGTTEVSNLQRKQIIWHSKDFAVLLTLARSVRSVCYFRRGFEARSNWTPSLLECTSLKAWKLRNFLSSKLWGKFSLQGLPVQVSPNLSIRVFQLWSRHQVFALTQWRRVILWLERIFQNEFKINYLLNNLCIMNMTVFWDVSSCCFIYS